VPLGRVWAFIPIYQSALLVNDLITAILLLGQFSFLRSRGLLLLAIGYLFTGFMAVVHLLTFPGLLSDTGLLGAGPPDHGLALHVLACRPSARRRGLRAVHESRTDRTGSSIHWNHPNPGSRTSAAPS
jgi:Membrane-associated sensor, integral membrane domain